MLIWHTHLIAAAGTQLHHVRYTFLLQQEVSYPTECIQTRIADMGIMTCAQYRGGSILNKGGMLEMKMHEQSECSKLLPNKYS